MKKNIVFGILSILLIGGVISAFVIFKNGLWDLFNPEPTKIETKVISVKEIKPIAELSTVKFYNEDVHVISKKVLGITHKLGLIAKGTVRAGLDLSKLSDKDIVVEHDSILSITLPPVGILDTIMNPEDYDIFIEGKKFSDEEVTDLKNEARISLAKRAISAGILDKAKENATNQLSSFFSLLGFKEKNIQIKFQELKAEFNSEPAG